MEMMSEHFARREFQCHGERCCGHAAPVSRELVAALEQLRAMVRNVKGFGDAKIHITSGFRCRTYNAMVGGAEDSTHCKGEAADIVVVGMPTPALEALAMIVPAFRDGGIGVYSCWLHVDVRRGGPARWEG